MNYFVSLPRICKLTNMKQGINNLLSDELKTRHLTAIILITACFALWGFANNVTSPMVNVFSKVFRIGTFEATLVPVVFNLGYFCMAFPAALFIQKYSYKWGVIVGLALYAAGTLSFFPARWIGEFFPFLGAYFVLTCGLSFLETSCNPYIYSLGTEQTAIQRLNGAQALNALGSVIGMMVVMGIHSQLSPMDTEHRMALPIQQFNIIKDYDLGILIQPYIFIGAIVLLILVLMTLMKLPSDTDIRTEKGALTSLRDLMHRRNYRDGVVAEFCYVGAQAACWTYIIQYGVRVFIAEGMEEHAAEMLAQKYDIAALVFFAVARFICTWLMNWFTPSRLLSTLSIVGMAGILGAIIFTDRNGLYCLLLVSGCLSLMFPTIYGIALTGVGEDIKIAGAGLVMAILGGSFFPPIQAAIIESKFTLFGLPSTNVSFFIPLVCLAIIALYGHSSYVRYHINGGADTPAKPTTELTATGHHR